MKILDTASSHQSAIRYRCMTKPKLPAQQKVNEMLYRLSLHQSVNRYRCKTKPKLPAQQIVNEDATQIITLPICHSLGTDVRQSQNYQPDRWYMKMFYRLSHHQSVVGHRCQAKPKLPAQQLVN